MNEPNQPLFLERTSYRRRRVGDAARLVPFVGLMLWLLPALWASDSRTADSMFYVFGVWALLIAAVWALSVRLRSVEPDDTEPGE